MGTAHRFIVAACVVLCCLVWPASQDLTHLAAIAAVADDAVIPAHVEPRHASLAPSDDCVGEHLVLRPAWTYIWEFLIREFGSLARWFSTGRLDAQLNVSRRVTEG